MSIVHNESLMRTVRVPRAVFPIALVGSHLVNLLLALVPLLIVMMWQGVPLRPSVLLLPYCLLTITAFTTGIALALAAWTVFFRDIAQIIEVGLTAVFYLTPVIYPLSVLPERYAWLFKLNPLYYQVVPLRSIFYEGRLPDFTTILVAGGLGLASFTIGLTVFRRRESLFLHYLS
jgi:ABC-2 type transport system permease protein